MLKKDLLGNTYLESENAAFKRGTKLQNKKSGKVITVVESWQSEEEIIYRCYVGSGRYKYVYEYQLERYEVIQ